MSKLGFKYLVMCRIDYKEKEIRMKKKELEFTWYPYWSLNKRTSIFTYIAHDHYSVNYNIFDKFVDEIDLGLRNKPNEIERILNKAILHFQKIREYYRSDNIFFFYGDDFTFYRANSNFLNIEALMDYIELNQSYKDKIEIFYSTSSQYFKSISDEKNDYPTYKDFDFFPYSDEAKVYWTGYFTTRPYLKGLIRDAGKYLSNSSKLLLHYWCKYPNDK